MPGRFNQLFFLDELFRLVMVLSLVLFVIFRTNHLSTFSGSFLILIHGLEAF